MLLLIIKYAKTLFRPPLTDHWLVEKHKLLRKSIYIYIYIIKKLEISVILEVMLQRLPLPDFDLIFVKSTCFTDLQNPLLRRKYIFKKVKNER